MTQASPGMIFIEYLNTSMSIKIHFNANSYISQGT